MNADETKTTAKATVNIPNMSDEALVALFRRAVRIMARSRHQHGHAQHAQKHVLAILGEREPLSQRDLLEMLGIRSASLGELLAKLERGGLIARERDKEDKRSSVVALTDRGRAEARTIGEDSRAHAKTLFAALTAAEKQQLGELLAKLIVSVEEAFPDHDPDHGHGLGCGRHGLGGGDERSVRSRREHVHGLREDGCEGRGEGGCGRRGRGNRHGQGPA